MFISAFLLINVFAKIYMWLLFIIRITFKYMIFIFADYSRDVFSEEGGL